MNLPLLSPRAIVPIKVRLSWSEMLLAGIVALLRRISNVKRHIGQSNDCTDEDDAWDFDIIGAFAEMAVAKHLNLYWNGNIGNYKADDVGPYQVRATKYATGKLRLQDKDKDDRKFILVTGTTDTFRLVGWIEGRNGKKPEYRGRLGDRKCEAYWVPQDQLKPMSELVL